MPNNINKDVAIVPDVKFIKTVNTERKNLNISATHCVYVPHNKSATFGMGCFWGAEALYGATKGVIRTTVGYAGGNSKWPTYRKLGDHTEVLEIEYDPNVISYKDLLHIFWNNHEYGLCSKIKRQYMSLILYHDEEQQRIAEESMAEEQERRAPEVIATQLLPKKNFYAAEDYHQKYRLQGHKDLATSLNLNYDLLQNSYVATKLNGYVAGVGGVEQFKTEVDTMGLTPTQREYVIYYIAENEGMGLYC